VPACFVEDIAKLNRTQDKHKAPGYKSSWLEWITKNYLINEHFLKTARTCI
jgi:hypothetical protein